MRNEDARRFVEAAKSHHPVLEAIVEEYGLKKPHQQAYCVEVIIEMLPCKTFVDEAVVMGVPARIVGKRSEYDAKRLGVFRSDRR